MSELESLGSESTKRILTRHGAREPFFGVKIGDLKKVLKKIKGDQGLALELYDTGNGDAQYLAGMVADGRRLTKPQLQRWAETASWSMIAGSTVPAVAVEHPEGLELALCWIDSADANVATAGWSTLGAFAAVVPDDRLPLKRFAALLNRVVKTIKKAPDRVRYAMNNFVIACGVYVEPLADAALETAKKLGAVEVDMGDTACQVPVAVSYIAKCRRDGRIAPKRKTMRC